MAHQILPLQYPFMIFVETRENIFAVYLNLDLRKKYIPSIKTSAITQQHGIVCHKHLKFYHLHTVCSYSSNFPSCSNVMPTKYQIHKISNSVKRQRLQFKVQLKYTATIHFINALHQYNVNEECYDDALSEGCTMSDTGCHSIQKTNEILWGKRNMGDRSRFNGEY